MNEKAIRFGRRQAIQITTYPDSANRRCTAASASGSYRLSAALGLTMRDGPPPSSALEQRLHESA